jgi:hypothetical protein
VDFYGHGVITFAAKRFELLKEVGAWTEGDQSCKVTGQEQEPTSRACRTYRTAPLGLGTGAP